MTVAKEEFDKAIASARNSAERVQIIGALLESATGEEVILVGGSAVDVYATGRQPSLDVDIVTEVRPAATVIESWGFERKKGRVWRREDMAMDIDLRGKNFTGSRRRIRTFATPYGPVRVISPEDLIAKRLSELKHWPTGPKWRRRIEEQLTTLLSEPGLDDAYLAFLAKRDDIVDILADFRRRVLALAFPHE